MKIRCAHKELVSVSDLIFKQNPKNNNRHSRKQIERLAKIIDFAGQRAPIVISTLSGFIIKGHARLLAIDKLGWDQAAVDYQEYATEAEEYQDMTADNEIARWAELDKDKLLDDLKGIDLGDIELLGIENLKINLEGDDGSDPADDEVPEVIEPTSKLGDIYMLGQHRLMCGDSTDETYVNTLMDGAKPDMVFTDPPYGINEETDRSFSSRTRKAKGNTFKKIKGDDSIKTALEAYEICERLSNIICYWGGNYYAHKFDPSACWIVWDKRVEEKQKDMNSDCEIAYVKHPAKKSIRIFRHLWKGMIKASENGEGRVHPTQKPVALAEWSINELNPKGKSVLDLFGGSGSTLIACEKMNRTCFMMEYEPIYIDTIIARWEKMTGRKAELIYRDPKNV